MNQVQGKIRSHGRSTVSAVAAWLRRSRRFVVALALLVGASAVAAVLVPTSPPTFCTASACFDTLDKAETSLRSSTAYYGAANRLEHMSTSQAVPTTLRMNYWLRNRRADTFYGPMFYADLGIYGQGKGDCNVPAADPSAGYSDWCGSESTLIGSVQRELATKWSGCTITGSSVRDDYSAPSLNGTATSTRGTVNFFFKGMTTTASCTNGSTRSHNWTLQKHKTLYCSTGFYPIAGSVSDATLQQAILCRPRNDNIAYIAVPIRQCASCAGSRHPVYPATGEKQRAEPDFTFAGQTFTRHYRSLRQFRNNRSFAVAWNHTWSDRIATITASTLQHIDEAGNYESYTLLSGNRYRSDNAVDRIVESVNANGIGWRLRLPDGEVREFDTAGYLIAVRHPQDPLNDLALLYTSDKSVSTITDAQGRVLRFEYADNLLQRIVLPDGSVYAYGYDANLNLTTVTSPGDRIKQYHYNEAGLAGAADQRHHLTGITSEDSQRFASFGYDARGRVVSSRVLGTPNELTTVSYPSEDSAMVQTAEGDSRAYTIEPGIYRRILGAVDSVGSDLQTFDAQGRLESSTDKRGILSRYEYAADYRSATITAVGTDEQRREEVTRDPATRLPTERRTLDKTGTLVARTTWTYNSRNQVLTVAAFDPDPATGAVRRTTMRYCEPADVTAGLCPVVGLRVSVDGPRAGNTDVVNYAYRMADEPTCSAAPTTCPYRKGDLWKTTNALGHVTEVLHSDGAGRPLSVKDASGVVTGVEYDPRGRITASKIRGDNDASEADDRITRIEYAPTGTVRRVTQPDGVFTQFDYDAALRLTSIVDPAGNRMSYTLDAAGERIREEIKDPGGALLKSLSRTYDTLGRLHTQTDAYQKTTTFGYDKDDNLTLTTDALTRKTVNDYDALGRLKATLQDVDGVAASTQFQYDALDRLTQVLDPSGLPTLYGYNGFGEVLTLRSPDTGLTTSTYDEAGNLKTRTDARGITAAYGYDMLNRITSVGYPDSSRNLAFEYDLSSTECSNGERYGTGRMTFMRDASGDTAYCYDRYGNLSRKLQLTQGRTFVLRYLHTDPRGRLPGQDYLVQNPPPGNQFIGMLHPDGSSVRIVRDAQSRPTELKVTLATGQTRTLLTGATYYPFGPVAQWTFGNGRVLKRSMNENYQPGFIEDTAPGGISEGYSFDAVGNLESLRKADQLDPARRTYRYDGLNRLTQVRDGASNAVLQAYAYDKTGNRSSRTDAGIATAYTYAPARHQLTQVGAQGRGYDAAGNTTRIGAGSASGGGNGDTPGEPEPGPGDPGPGHPGPGTPETQATGSTGDAGTTLREFAYDDANRMRQVKHDGVVAMSYLYNGKGEQVYKTGSGKTIATIYDEAGRWIGDYDANGQPIQQAIWLDELPVGLLVGAGANQKLYYIEADALGTPRVVIDAERNVAVWRWDLAGEAFGDSAPNEDVDNDGTAFVFDMRMPGQRWDSATGMSQNYFRDYDPAPGRYVQSDPIGLLAGLSTYSYVSGSPLIWSDMYGLLQWSTNPIQWSPTLVPGLQTHTYPGSSTGVVRPETGARTTIDWSIGASCTCIGGGFSFQEFTVAFTPIVFIRQSYLNREIRQGARSDEMDHVRDLRRWIDGARAGAQALENSFKQQSYATQGDCENSAKQGMQSFLQGGASQAVRASRERWDVSGRHSIIVPGP